MTSRQQFLQLLNEDSVNLCHVALLAVQVLKQDSPSAESATHSALSQLERLCEQARVAGCEESLERLVSHLGTDLGFKGNSDQYYSVDNSDLSLVLTRRTGIPITLAILYLEIGRSMGFDLRGIGFPGHFLVGQFSDATPELALIDPFAARVTSRQECLAQLARGTAPTAADKQWPQAQIDSWFAPASPHQITLRLLENLKQIHLQQAAKGPALAALELQLLVSPESFELREQQRALMAQIFGQDTGPQLH